MSSDPNTQSLKELQAENLRLRRSVEELSILSTEPRGSELLDNEFVEICHELLLPVMEQVEIDTNV